jgi:hypothetical protein
MKQQNKKFVFVLSRLELCDQSAMNGTDAM